MGRRTVTRGHGLLESTLARWRARRADKLIPGDVRSGRILDIGCGSYPMFLLGVRFAERYGIDQGAPEDLAVPGVMVAKHDIAAQPNLPFSESFFNAVTMLAVVEHLDRPVVARTMTEIHRVLRPGGWLVITTPAPWTDLILKSMARIRLVSAEEITEHRDLYSRSEVVRILTTSGFDAARVTSGTFEGGVNLWFRAQRS
jgi:SAM-dependent methyltransferase